MRACPYCAEQIQSAAILCRFCGREIAPVNQSEAMTATPKPRLPTQRYAIDERIKRASTRVDQKRGPSIWAKIGGALAPTAPGPTPSREGGAGPRAAARVRAEP